MDNIAIFGKHVHYFKDEVMKEFEIKDVGPADLMLGIKVTYCTDYISFDQQNFTKSLLDLHGIINCNSVATPLVSNEHLSLASISEISDFGKLKVNFCSAVGSMNYLSTATRPKLLFAVSTLSQYLENPGMPHWKAFLHVLKNLKGARDLGLIYPRGMNVGILAYSDADWGNCHVSQWSVTGFLATVGASLVLWRTRKQPAASLSTTEEEYKSLCDLTSELLWFGQ
ncbi:hypothetical protein O181_112651 [Austropuccinia psidii MF-1]|uniref:Reverse transcriptase Ty1/copia-type domain-containing protein n=1 Tax=Austropuccinia psidii MF-1 TaxID=1389203 RepID=A0A9Q3K3F4_9BASI|nr:hypothetical protein [Austropuccinia psidii MF-1]